MYNISDEQWKVVRAVFKWIEIRRQEGHDVSLDHLDADAAHSVLLPRLINGKRAATSCSSKSFFKSMV